MTKYQLNDKVECIQGTKSGVGTVIDVLPEGCLVTFPSAKYPITMVQITGTYFIPNAHIIRRAL